MRGQQLPRQLPGRPGLQGVRDLQRPGSSSFSIPLYRLLTPFQATDDVLCALYGDVIVAANFEEGDFAVRAFNLNIDIEITEVTEVTDDMADLD